MAVRQRGARRDTGRSGPFTSLAEATTANVVGITRYGWTPPYPIGVVMGPIPAAPQDGSRQGLRSSDIVVIFVVTAMIISAALIEGATFFALIVCMIA